MTAPSASTSKESGSGPSADIRLYKNRASYALPAALAIFHENPIAHVAFIHPGDPQDAEGGAGREETIMNVPLITVIIRDSEFEDDDAEEDDQDMYSVYLHTHRHSGLVEAILSGRRSVTATTTKIDGMIFSPTAHDHTLNYRSATLHLKDGRVLDDDIGSNEHEEKRRVLAAVTNTVTDYDRISVVGQPEDPAVKRTTVIKFKISKISCKQRFGGFNGAKEPELDTPKGKESDSFTGVIPCWTQWGNPIGYGKDTEQIKELVTVDRSNDNKEFAEKVAWANEDVQIEGLGKKRKQINK